MLQPLLVGSLVMNDSKSFHSPKDSSSIVELTPKLWSFWCPRCLFNPFSSYFHRIGWWENLQETPIFDGKNHGFRLRFSLKPIHWYLPATQQWPSLLSAPWRVQVWARVLASRQMRIQIKRSLARTDDFSAGSMNSATVGTSVDTRYIINCRHIINYIDISSTIDIISSINHSYIIPSHAISLPVPWLRGCQRPTTRTAHPLESTMGKRHLKKVLRWIVVS
jgi:hypothetical protein